MNINPNIIRVLCYGDSNTYGANPKTDERYPSNVRWTGVLQKLLGDDYEIIEEGLGGRTTIFERENRPGRNGKTYLLPCVKSHSPFDVIIVNLGTNDFKDKSLTAKDVAEGEEELIKIIQENAYNKNDEVPKIILVCPPDIDDANDYAINGGLADTSERIKQLPVELQKLAEKYNAGFVNLQEFVKPSSEDGVHLSPESHKIIAEVLSEEIKL
jgi:lysophospholipase L1-like esterase